MTYITKEQSNLVVEIHDNHEAEFRKWADENESELMSWYDTQPPMRFFEAAEKFSYYCATKFMEYKKSNVEEA